MGTPIWLSGDGTTDGRIQPTGWTPPDGVWALCLGSDVPGQTGRLEVGDYLQAAQSGTYPAQVMRLRARMRGPSSVPDGVWWEAAVLVGGASVLVHRIDADTLHDYADIGWEVTSGGSGALAFTLTLRGTTGLVVEPELPAFYVDAITFAAPSASDVRLYNRYPEPGSTGARADANIQFDVFPGSTTASTLTVTVGGVVAYTAGAFTAPFAGAKSAVTSVSGGLGSLRFVIDPLAIWGNEQLVTVAVTSSDPSAAPGSWSFTAERTSGPEIASVMAQGYQQIRVTFDEAPVASSSSGTGDALNPANYAITRTPGVISVQPAVTGVTQVSATSFDLATDLELSPSCPYTLTILDVADPLGNVTAATSPGATAPFTSWQPPVPAGRVFSLYGFFSDDARAQDQSGELLALMTCIQDCVDLLLYDIDSFPDICDPSLAPERFVDAMLADLGNPFTFTLTLTQKRLLATLLVPIYQQKGTSPGIVNAVRLFTGIEVQVDAIGFGVSLDGVSDILGDGGAFPGTFILGSTVGQDPFAFELVVVGTASPTDAQVAIIDQIVTYVMRGECSYLGIAPTPIPPVVTPVILDGPMGTDSVLGDGSEENPGTFVLH